jgi:hypothetical protein
MVLHCGLSSEVWHRRIDTKKGPLVHQKQLRKKKMKMGDDVTDDEDDDAVRTSVSRDQVTATLCTEELSSVLSIYSSLHTSDRSNAGRGGGHGWST